MNNYVMSFVDQVSYVVYVFLARALNFFSIELGPIGLHLMPRLYFLYCFHSFRRHTTTFIQYLMVSLIHLYVMRSTISHYM